MSDTQWAQDLVALLAALRHPKTGCPWDLKQDWNSLTKHTIEEVYECVDAIENNDSDHVKEELGDLLFHIFFYAQIAQENNLFSIQDIAQDLVEKMHARHPHVFEGAPFESVEKHLHEWEKGKINSKTAATALGEVPNALPALMRAQKVQKKAATFGFDWPDHIGPLEKCREELSEVEEQLSEQGTIEGLEEEIGDLLFSVVNLARHSKLDAEMALRKATDKFIERLSAVEKNSVSKGLCLEKSSIEELEALWITAKKQS